MKFIFLLFFALIVSCQRHGATKTEADRDIVLCFEHYKSQSYKTPAGVTRIDLPIFSYIDSTQHLRHYIPSTEYDTLVLKSPKPFLEIALNYRNWEYVYYPLMQGDTITVTMDSLGYPVLKSKHHSEYTRIYNTPYKLRKGSTHLGLESKTCLGDSYFLRIANGVDHIRAHKDLEVLLKDYCPLDSLHAMFHRYRTAYTDTINIYKQEKLISDEVYGQYKFYLLLKEHESKRFIDRDSSYYRQMETGITDQFIQYPSYREYLDHYVRYYVRNVKTIVEPQGRYADWRQTFDELSTKPFQPVSKQLLLERCLNEIGEYFPANDLYSYLDKYVALTQDSVLYREIISRYNLSADDKQLLVEDAQGNKTDLQQVLDKHKGKVVYVDFWASWCAPCRAEMAPAARLRKKCAGEDIVFVYLAYNDSEAGWKKAIREEGLTDVATNYFILNSKNSKMLEKIGLSLIPRYLIFDKSGNLVEMNAPRPSSEQVLITLNKYL